jgi:predicted membrane protein
MSDQKYNVSHRIWLGGILIVLGLLFLLNSLDIMDFGDFVSTWWPLILIVFGINRIVNRSALFLGTVILLLGIIFQLQELNIFPGNVFKYIWPLALILFGLWLVARSAGYRMAGNKTENLDRVNLFTLWGGVEKKINSSQFSGGEATALMGGIKLNLSEAGLSSGNNELKVTALMGGVEIIVPEGWNVLVSGSPILGGIEDKTKKTGAASATSGTLRLSSFVLMGGIEVKN